MSSGQRDVIEQEPPRGRWVAGAVLAVLLGLPLVVLLTGRESTPPPAAAPPPLPSPTAEATPDANMLHPREHGTGARRTIRVVFPDGTPAEVSYPRDLGLADLGMRPFISATLAGRGSMDKFRVLFAPEDTIGSGYLDNMIRPLTGNVSLWAPPNGATGHYLLFEFGRWRVVLPDLGEGMTFEERMDWAVLLTARQTEDGFLVFSAKKPLELTRAAEVREGRPVGPQLWFGTEPPGAVTLALHPDCDRLGRVPMPIERSSRYWRTSCQGDVQVAAAGEQDFVNRVIATVRVKLQFRPL